MTTTLLANQIILITGASSGIGAACAETLAELGAKLILLARRQARLEALAHSLQSRHNTECFLIKADVRDEQQIKTAITSLPEDWKKIDVLINNSGLALGTDPMQSSLTANWDTMIDTNLKGLLYMTHAVLPGMLERQKGHIINIGSIAGQEHYPNGNIYSATKHAVRAISKSLRLDLLGTPLRVSEIAPGAVQTEFSAVRWADQARSDAFYQDFTPLTAGDVARAVAFCIMQPPHVNISEITLSSIDQASANHIHRRKS